jgi:hypothetical protein
VKRIEQVWWTRSLGVKAVQRCSLSGRRVGRQNSPGLDRERPRWVRGFEERLSELRRRAGVRGAVRLQMVQDFSNEFLFGNEGYHAEGAPALTFQRVG